MGKHEVIKPAGTTSKSTERVRKHREAMRAKGFRLKQVWVPDRDDPDFRKRLQEECRIIAEFEHNNKEEMAFWDEVAAHSWDDLPD